MIYCNWSLFSSTIVIWGSIGAADLAGVFLFGDKVALLEQHLEEQRSSLTAVDEALAADASNVDLLEVRMHLSVSVLEHIARY
ncbi:zinc finger CCCH domain-containing protein 18 [Hordeum vulgare]|nr:zinc finger CCCH domain-containing protein 18 [Hordeum vulgare]